MPGVFMRAAWRNLTMVNFAIDPKILEPLVPSGTELEYWQGRTFVSIVGFRFLNTKVLGIPLLLHGDFPELNLRFYVRRVVDGTLHSGVVFLKEIVPTRAFMIALGARLIYRENYVALPMRSEVSVPGISQYDWKTGGGWNRLRAETRGNSFVPEAGHPGNYFSEHYWGFAAQRDGSTLEYQVEHPPWNIWETQNVEFDCRVAELYGEQFRETLTAKPHSAFIADGSDVIVRKGVRIS